MRKKKKQFFRQRRTCKYFTARNRSSRGQACVLRSLGRGRLKWRSTPVHTVSLSALQLSGGNCASVSSKMHIITFRNLKEVWKGTSCKWQLCTWSTIGETFKLWPFCVISLFITQAAYPWTILSCILVHFADNKCLLCFSHVCFILLEINSKTKQKKPTTTRKSKMFKVKQKQKKNLMVTNWH